MKLVYSFYIEYNDELFELCKISKCLYNQALYIVKKELETNKKWLFYNDLNRIMKITKNLDGKINYKLLKAQVSQQCLMLLDKDIKSYIKNIKCYSKNKDKYKAKPKFPNYKPKTNLLVYTKQSCKIKDGYVYLSKNLKIRIPQYNKYKEKLSDFQQVRIIPQKQKKFKVDIVYNYDKENKELNYNMYSSIDFGVNNLITQVLPNCSPIIYNGKIIKEKNQYFNKTISILKSKLTNNRKTSKQIEKLYNKRNNQINDIFHKVTRNIVNNLIEKGVGNLVVGYNSGWKDSINLGNKLNQTFMQIPYRILINYLKYKCEMCGIKFIETEESYTSKCDSLAFEKIEKHDTYLGKRIKRGLFQSSTGKLINADVNGALNIMRKVVGDSELVVKIANSGWLFQPLRVDVFNKIH